MAMLCLFFSFFLRGIFYLFNTVVMKNAANFELKTHKLVNQLKENNANPEKDALLRLAAACGSERFDVMNRVQREGFANSLIETAQVMRSLIH